ncbi:hypothetical protein ADICYQ_5801 [Cyclobacterium qasimii M12-11B]|uniref:Uncharacterized protein n=1 Tax=Cyclobacterium qasimii M12-11B TaxID=641524 RepID=S7WM55_9BACT|nr:hypothetical protein ADICYQ_5801 [Cyclobacterium qasimii M12-11B]
MITSNSQSNFISFEYLKIINGPFQYNSIYPILKFGLILT